ncbi:hypothetical protein DFH27DRAFT_528841 [Peziza echinospora]|nr:hypothetical protein DFH27DRAFT_529981 [Peziza echinospora]KAI5782855.1 hypothetical protein DFH27DRAFT_528841 [Peziza echinospora]
MRQSSKKRARKGGKNQQPDIERHHRADYDEDVACFSAKGSPVPPMKPKIIVKLPLFPKLATAKEGSDVAGNVDVNKPVVMENKEDEAGKKGNKRAAKATMRGDFKKSKKKKDNAALESQAVVAALNDDGEVAEQVEGVERTGVGSADSAGNSMDEGIGNVPLVQSSIGEVPMKPSTEPPANSVFNLSVISAATSQVPTTRLSTEEKATIVRKNLSLFIGLGEGTKNSLEIFDALYHSVQKYISIEEVNTLISVNRKFYLVTLVLRFRSHPNVLLLIGAVGRFKTNEFKEAALGRLRKMVFHHGSKEIPFRVDCYGHLHGVPPTPTTSWVVNGGPLSTINDVYEAFTASYGGEVVPPVTIARVLRNGISDGRFVFTLEIRGIKRAVVCERESRCVACYASGHRALQCSSDGYALEKGVSF